MSFSVTYLSFPAKYSENHRPNTCTQLLFCLPKHAQIYLLAAKTSNSSQKVLSVLVRTCLREYELFDEFLLCVLNHIVPSTNTDKQVISPIPSQLVLHWYSQTEFRRHFT